MEMTLKLTGMTEQSWTKIFNPLVSTRPAEAVTPTMNARQKEALLPEDLQPATRGTENQTIHDTQDKAAGPLEQARQNAQKANAYLKMADTHLEFQVSEETGQTVVKVVNTDSKEVVRQIPPESLNRINNRMNQMRGLLFETTV